MVMMPSLSGIGRTVFCLLLLWKRTVGKALVNLPPFIFKPRKAMTVLWREEKYQMGHFLCSNSQRSLIEESERKWKLLHRFFWGIFSVPSGRSQSLSCTHQTVYCVTHTSWRGGEIQWETAENRRRVMTFGSANSRHVGFGSVCLHVEAEHT